LKSGFSAGKNNLKAGRFKINFTIHIYIILHFRQIKKRLQQNR